MGSVKLGSRPIRAARCNEWPPRHAPTYATAAKCMTRSTGGLTALRAAHTSARWPKSTLRKLRGRAGAGSWATLRNGDVRVAARERKTGKHGVGRARVAQEGSDCAHRKRFEGIRSCGRRAGRRAQERDVSGLGCGPMVPKPVRASGMVLGAQTYGALTSPDGPFNTRRPAVTLSALMAPALPLDRLSTTVTAWPASVSTMVACDPM